MSDSTDYEWLTSPEAAPWLDELSASEEPLLGRLQRLRKILGPERSRLLVEQGELRDRAATKFGSLARKMFFTDIALQQATDVWIARYKASQIKATGPLLDYCCGIGGDLLALAEQGAAKAWDCDPVMVRLAQANLRANGLASRAVADLGKAEDHPPDSDCVWHLDPDRRPSGHRTTQVVFHSPGPEVVQNWFARAPRGLLKLAPAADVPTSWAESAELEWISRGRECRQLVVWFGELAREPGKRRATGLMQEQGDFHAIANSITGHADSSVEEARAPEDYLYDTDPAVRAARLTAALGADLQLERFGPSPGYLTGRRLISHPLLTSFRVLEVLPFRVKPLSRHLHSLGIGRLEIKKRGIDIDVDRLRAQLKLKGDESATLLLSRVDRREVAILSQRTGDGLNATGFSS